MKEIYTNKQIKSWCKFHRRLKSIGVNGLTQERFIEKLKGILTPKSFNFCYNQKNQEIIVGNKIHIADVRQNPNVKPKFRSNDLKKIVEDNGWEYQHYKHLGNPYYKNHLKENNPLKAKREFLTYLHTNEEAKADLDKLFQQFRFRKIICLLCYCNKDVCHRFWIIESLRRKKRIQLRMKIEKSLPLYIKETLQEVN